jgi:hypothetical protein
MRKIILTINNVDIIGSDGLLYVDGRYNIESIKEFIRARNYRLKKNFPHKVCDGFYFVNDRLERTSKTFTLINPLILDKSC